MPTLVELTDEYTLAALAAATMQVSLTDTYTLETTEATVYTARLGDTYTLEPREAVAALRDQYTLVSDDEETAVTLRKHPVSGDLVAMPILLKVDDNLVDTVTGATWTP